MRKRENLTRKKVIEVSLILFLLRHNDVYNICDDSIKEVFVYRRLENK